MTTPSEFVRISDLPVMPDPLVDNTLFVVSAGGVSYQMAARKVVLPADPLITAVDFTSSLTSSRYLAAGPGISMVDGGAGGPFTISASTSGQIIIFDQTVSADLSGTEQDWNPTGWDASSAKNRLQVTPLTAPGIIGGLDATAAVDGQMVALINEDATNMVRLTHRNAGSAPANWINTPGGANLSLVPFQCVFLMYQTGTGWRVFT